MAACGFGTSRFPLCAVVVDAMIAVIGAVIVAIGRLRSFGLTPVPCGAARSRADYSTTEKKVFYV